MVGIAQLSNSEGDLTVLFLFLIIIIFIFYDEKIVVYVTTSGNDVFSKF